MSRSPFVFSCTNKYAGDVIKVVVTRHDTQQCTNNGSEKEEDCKLVNMDETIQDSN